jgi:hypothetical protein
MGDPAPLPHEPRTWPQGDRLYGFGRAAALRIGVGVLQLPVAALFAAVLSQARPANSQVGEQNI